MSRLTRQLVASIESGPLVSENIDNTQVISPTFADGDSPEIQIHGIYDAKDEKLEDIRKGLNADAADALRVVTGQVSFESQQLDDEALKTEEQHAQTQADIQQQQDNLDASDDVRSDIKRVYVLHGVLPEEDPDNGISATFTALNQAVIEDPTNTVAAFLPIEATPGTAVANPLQTREEEAMKDVLRQHGVPFVTSVEALCEHLNFWASGRKEYSVAAESMGTVKLRVGMKVKYSHGEGKIIKIFDRPTRYNGEIHHCSKEKPKYEVKALHGGKTSLHHASALRPV